MNPRMLQTARESRGLSQSKLASMTGISQAVLSKAEHGLVPLPPERLHLVAEALGYPPELLEWPDDPIGLGASSYYHRKQAGLGQMALRRIEAEINLFIMQLKRLETSVDIDPVHPLPTFDTPDAAGPDPEEAARKLRAAWLVPDGPVREAIRMVERAGVVVVRRDLGSPKISGMSIRPPDSLPVIILNAGMAVDRERFTIFHEVGHLVMHQVPSEDGEREADQFAAEFLMPAQNIGPQLNGINLQRAMQLKQHWKTSMASIIRRAHTLGKIDASRYRSLHVQMAQRGFNRHEPVTLEPEDSRILPAVLDAHRSLFGYSDAELAKVVGLKIPEFRAGYGTQRALRAV
jgi:Zn-dependent peptidase ImmA (M78 family)/transcriptional regulator with XRE-family HTH domain